MELGRQFGVVMIPMQVLLNGEGKVVFKHNGYISTKELSKQINNHFNLNK